MEKMGMPSGLQKGRLADKISQTDSLVPRSFFTNARANTDTPPWTHLPWALGLLCSVALCLLGVGGSWAQVECPWAWFARPLHEACLWWLYISPLLSSLSRYHLSLSTMSMDADARKIPAYQVSGSGKKVMVVWQKYVLWLICNDPDESQEWGYN